MPGERISKEAIAYLRTILSAGGYLTGCSDPSLETLLVVRD